LQKFDILDQKSKSFELLYMSSCDNCPGSCGITNSDSQNPTARNLDLPQSATNAHLKGKFRSKELTGDFNNKEQWIERSAARAMMRAVGYGDSDFEKPLVAVATPFTNITPCNAKIRDLGEIVAGELERLGAKTYSFGTPVVTDGQSMGMSGMKYSLPSRDLIADSIEMMQEAYACDASVTLSGCDKTIPGALMPLARNNLVGITMYGGSILPGEYKNEELNIVSTFEAIGKYSSGKIDYDEFMKIEGAACPTCGSCGGMYTANTMASAIEAMGMSVPYSSSNPATNHNNRISEAKYDDCLIPARCLVNILQKDIKARDIMTKKAFENAITIVMALGGSTNAVLHLIALAKDAEVELNIDDFNRIGEKVPLISDLKPSGRYMMYDLYKIGGVPTVLKELWKAGLIHGDCLTVTGKTIAENIKDAVDIKDYLQTVQKHRQNYLNEVKQSWVKEAIQGF
jgi:dihydroxy-acid dehydratase